MTFKEKKIKFLAYLIDLISEVNVGSDPDYEELKRDILSQLQVKVQRLEKTMEIYKSRRKKQEPQNVQENPGN